VPNLVPAELFGSTEWLVTFLEILTVERFQCLLKNVNHLCGGHTEQVVEKETSPMTWVRFK
jgi:hypothetical protein